MRSAPAQQTRYDPLTERNPLIARHITRSSISGEPVFRSAIPYPVGAVVQQLLVTGNDRVAVRRSYPELSDEALDAAERFGERYGDEIRRYLEDAE